jgi:hypothetical protein
MTIARTHTNRLLEMIEDGLIDAQIVVEMALTYMSEDQVRDMMDVNGLSEYEEEPEYQPSEYTEWQDVYGGDDAFETCSYCGEE